MNLSGEWLYNEEFELGISTGVLKIEHNASEQTLKGEIRLLENEVGETPIYVKQNIEGIVLENKVILKSKSYEILNGKKTTEYYLDSWEGIINSDGDIVGNTIDLDGACGVFILKKLEDF